MLDLMRDIILATDLAHHLRIFKDLQRIADRTYQGGCCGIANISSVAGIIVVIMLRVSIIVLLVQSSSVTPRATK